MSASRAAFKETSSTSSSAVCIYKNVIFLIEF